MISVISRNRPFIIYKQESPVLLFVLKIILLPSYGIFTIKGPNKPPRTHSIERATLGPIHISKTRMPWGGGGQCCNVNNIPRTRPFETHGFCGRDDRYFCVFYIERWILILVQISTIILQYIIIIIAKR